MALGYRLGVVADPNTQQLVAWGARPKEAGLSGHVSNANIPVGWSKRRPGRRPVDRIEGRRSRDEQDALPFGEKYACATHQISYYRIKGTPQQQRCPVCESDTKIEDLLVEMKDLKNQLSLAQESVLRLQPEVDLLSAIRETLDVLGEEDRLWLKTQLYQYKLDRSVTLHVTHGRPVGARSGSKNRANGFMAIPITGEPEAYPCTSIGGLAIANYCDEAISSMGSAKTMALLMRAMWRYLPGAST